MSINVYWSCLEKEVMRATPPESAINLFYKSEMYDADTRISKCPSFNKYMNNVYYLRSIYDYSFISYNDSKIASTSFYDQNFFDNHVIVRSNRSKMFSFTTQFIFFTDEDSLEMSVEQPSIIENSVVNNLIFIPGSFDIGKWYRNIDFAFYMKNNVNIFSIEQDEIFCQLRFHTDKKINFIKFYESEKLNDYKNLVLDSKKHKTKTKTLEYYYDIFDLKKKIIKEIKKNCV